VALQLMADSTEISGVNTVEQLAEINQIYKERKK
jgi:bifunctional N-acetylglucosamine-1-phosphate-uridyltransferase/glucosamine-1-phosphate-acetyltransferase GlmU-like protein